MIIIKVSTELSEKEIEKFSQNVFKNSYYPDDHFGNDDWDFILFEQSEMHEQLKDGNVLTTLTKTLTLMTKKSTCTIELI